MSIKTEGVRLLLEQLTEKWRISKAQKIAGLLLVASLAVGVSAAVFSAAQRSERMAQLKQQSGTGLQAVSAAMTELAPERVDALTKLPMLGMDYKKISSLLQKVQNAGGYERIFLVYQPQKGQYAVVADSAYQDGAAAGSYIAPGEVLDAQWQSSAARVLDKVYQKQEAEYRFVDDSAQEKEQLYAGVPVFSRNGQLQAALVAQFPADGLSAGWLDFGLISYLGFLIFAISLAVLVILRRRDARLLVLPAKQVSSLPQTSVEMPQESPAEAASQPQKAELEQKEPEDAQ